MKKWLLPIRIMVLFLACLSLLASFFWSEGESGTWLILLRNFALVLGGEFVVFFTLQRWMAVGAFRWEHFAITSLILFLLFDTLTPWWVFLVLGMTTQTIERFLRVPGGPLFNPAASGAFFMSIFGFFPSWWGTNFAPRFPFIEGGMSIAFFLTIAIAGFLSYRYKKLPIIFSAVPIFLLAQWLLVGQDPLYIVLEGTFAFFFCVMIVEPKTSPNQSRPQLIYGALIALLIPIGIRLHSPDAYLSALLLANLYTQKGFLVRLIRPSKNPPLSSSENTIP